MIWDVVSLNKQDLQCQRLLFANSMHMSYINSLLCNFFISEVNKFSGEDRSDASNILENDEENIEANLKATAAIVSLNVAIEGDSTLLPGIRFRQDLLDALSQLASDAQVDDCLVSAEVLWAPEERWEVMTANDIYADYPNLVPL